MEIIFFWSCAANSLSDQLGQSANAAILRLQLEKKRLEQSLQAAVENTAHENNIRITELEKENARLSEKLQKLQV